MLRQNLCLFSFLLCFQSCLWVSPPSGSTLPPRASINAVAFYLKNFKSGFLKYQVWDGIAFVVLELDEEPEYLNGGNEVFMASIYSQLHYPSEAKRRRVQGTVMVSLVIDEYGEMEALGVENKIGAGCEAAALDATSSAASSGFKPASKEGKARKIKLAIPIVFSLEGSGFKIN